MWRFDNGNILTNGVKCVIPVAGHGKRLKGLTRQRPKSLIEYRKKPILYYVLNFWRKFTDEFIFIVGYKKELIIDWVEKESKNLGIKYSFIEQKETKGIAHAVLLTEEYISNDFIVVLGDCVAKGKFEFPSEFENGIGVWETDNISMIKNSYAVDIHNNKVIKVIEKPKEIINNLCGMGFYFFNPIVFKFIKETPPSSLRNEVEITDVIQRMIENNHTVVPLFFKGDYVNINIPEDIEKLEEFL